MSELEIKATGVIHSIEELYHKEGSEYHSIKFTLKVPNEYSETYPHYLQLELGNKVDAEYDNVGDFAKFRKVGEELTVTANVTGSVWTKPETGKEMTFNKLKVWKTEKVTKEEEEAPEFDAEEAMDGAPF